MAHPLATTAVVISRGSGGRLHVSIEAESDPLIAKLEALANLPPTRASTGVARSDRLRALAPVLVREIGVTVDDAAVDLVFREVVTDQSAQSVVTFDGPEMASDTRVTWRCAFIFGSYPVVFRGDGGGERVEWVAGSQLTPAVTFARGPQRPGLVQGMTMGFTHIVPRGLDHILFVLGLFLLNRRWRDVMMQVTAFTVAHSITLGLGAIGLVAVPPMICEPLIALSVAYVGVENLVTSSLRPWRVGIVFAFGLLHGLGFAEALSRLELSTGSLLVTLFSFNVGVELGQLAVIGIGAGALALIVHGRMVSEPMTARFASAAIGVAGLVWTVVRLA